MLCTLLSHALQYCCPPSLAPQMHPDKVQGSEEEKAEAAKKFSDVSHGAC